MFQSTHPHGVRHAIRITEADFLELFQSTHPHGVRRVVFSPRAAYLVVSIHAPTRGATKDFPSTSNQYSVSIHAPTRGATAGGGDSTDIRGVSIHAPTRGATTFNPVDERRSFLFQSTHPHGVRHILPKVLIQLISFNPRTHTGCDMLRQSSCLV